MTARMHERRYVDHEYIEIDGRSVKIAPCKTQYKVENAQVLLRFADNTPAVQCVGYGKGKLYLFGFSIGYSYCITEDAVWEKLTENILSEVNLEKYAYADFKNGIYEKRLMKDDLEIIFISNYSEEDIEFAMAGQVEAVGAFASAEGNVIRVPANHVGYAVVKTK